METSLTPKLVVYAMGVRVAYIGELVSDTDTTLVMKRVLKLETDINPQTGEVLGNSIGPVPHASRDSKVNINKEVIAGMLIDDPDADLLKVYDREITACYSKLKIA